MNSLKSPQMARLAVAIATLGVSAACAHAQALLLHYDFDQASGNTALDLASNPANGTLTGAGSTWTVLPPVFNATHAYSNSGANGTYITAGDVAKLDGLGSFTISGWLNVTEANTAAFVQDRIASKRGASGSFFDLKFADTGAGSIGMSLEINTTVGASMTVTSTAMNMSDWFFFAVTRDGATGEVSFYYGTTEGSLTAAGVGIGREGAIVDNTAAFMIGNAAANTGRAPVADFSDFRIYSGVLNQQAIHGIQLQAIPEPASVLYLGGAALAGALWLRRRETKDIL